MLKINTVETYHTTQIIMNNMSLMRLFLGIVQTYHTTQIKNKQYVVDASNKLGIVETLSLQRENK